MTYKVGDKVKLKFTSREEAHELCNEDLDPFVPAMLEYVGLTGTVVSDSRYLYPIVRFDNRIKLYYHENWLELTPNKDVELII